MKKSKTVGEYIDLLYKGMLLLSASILAGIGTSSIAIGSSVFFGLLFVTSE